MKKDQKIVVNIGNQKKEVKAVTSTKPVKGTAKGRIGSHTFAKDGTLIRVGEDYDNR